jgi:prephenate dehydrogenase
MTSSLSTGGSLPASPRVLGVVGVGLIGTSVALAARRRWPDVRIIGVDRPAVLLQQNVAHTIDIPSPDLAPLRAADVIVLATPVDAIQDTIRALPRASTQAALILDTGSTKRHIMATARDAGLRNFVGGHPMAGAALPGTALARADLFDGRIWFLVDGPTTELTMAARAFVEGLGARVQCVDADTHDRVVAAVSHLPQVVASVLMTVVADAAGSDGLAWSGNGLRDTTRLAASSADMWTSLLASNASYVAPLLVEVGNALRGLAEKLDDQRAIEQVFRHAAAARARLDEPQ